MNKICKVSLYSMILVCFTNMPVDARVNIKNDTNSRVPNNYQVNNYYSQQMQNLATTASDTGVLPVAVDDKALAESILNNTSETTTYPQLERCSMIYPSGVFKWGIPESGVRRPASSTCISVVELRDANTNTVLAQTTLAAGDLMKCNIDMFPKSGQFETINNFELPADNPPTMEDVEAVMNEEQKQNAGLKIAAAAIISGVAGNMLAPKQTGDTKLMGTGKTQLVDTALGAAAGAGIMAASTYSGKVAGDTIKSTAVNAAAGMVVGNMAAGASGSDSVLNITKCKVGNTEKDCLIGKVAKIGGEGSNYSFVDFETEKFYLINNNNYVLVCEKNNADDAVKVEGFSWNDGKNNTYKCTSSSRLVDIYVKGDTSKPFSQFERSNYDKAVGYAVEKQENGSFVKAKQIQGDNVFYIVSSGKIPSTMEHAYAVFNTNLDPKPMGYKMSDWKKLEGKIAEYYPRNPSGSVGDTPYNKAEIFFEPSTKDASDGGLVDMSNQARTKGTLVGTAAGGALGGWSGYQGAKQEVADRWTAAVYEYEGSLSNFYCATGNRFLSKYNDTVEIPELGSDE